MVLFHSINFFTYYMAALVLAIGDMMAFITGFTEVTTY